MMMMGTLSFPKLVVILLSLTCSLLLLPGSCKAAAITYDSKGIIINGQRKILISGSIHYPRSTPEMWGDLIQKAKTGGIDVIDTYVFWNGHEPSPGKYNFAGRYDLVGFIKTVQRAGLYVTLRIGPYVCAEWNFGGFPVWLKFVPGITFRTDNEPFKRAMQGFTEKIVQMMKSEKLFASQGGPIILSQVENEYGSVIHQYGAAGTAYMNWAAKMAVGTNTGVPWLMCKEEDAPDSVINTCNGFYCDYFKPNRHNSPKMWTEAWSGWFTDFGHPIYQRPVQDLAFAVARFIQSGGSYFNYYMYHGGTNFGHTAGGPFITTSYDYDAPIDEYGWLRQPKYGHLKELHRAIKLCEPALVSSDNPRIKPLGSYHEAHVFSSGKGSCAAFLTNYHATNPAKVMFNHKHYDLPPWSISILPDCRNVVFNTAVVGEQTSNYQMVPANTRILSWETYDEDLSSTSNKPTMTARGLLDQVNITRDTSDYLWYTTSVQIDPSEPFLHGGEPPTSLHVDSAGHALHVFINGELSGSAYGAREARRFHFDKPVNLRAGTNRIALLSMAAGLPNIGARFETSATGVLGPVVIHGLREGRRDLSSYTWSYQVGLTGEKMNLYTPNGASSIEWMQQQSRGGVASSHTNQPLRWNKAYFNLPNGQAPLALDMGSMGRGEVWINGQSIGRYWTQYAKGDCRSCSYAGTYRYPKCQTGCGAPTQRWYHVPRSWLHPGKNLIVVLEELGGDASRISVVKRSVSSVCADVFEHHPSTANWRRVDSSNNEESLQMLHQAKAHVHCPDGLNISSIKFASFGTPLGTCGSFATGKCHSSNSLDLLEKTCLGQEKCTVAVSNSHFGEDPCPNELKRLSVEAQCS